MPVFYRGKELRRNTRIDPQDALEMCMDSDSDLDLELNLLGSDSEAEADSYLDEPGPSDRYPEGSTREPGAKRRRVDVPPPSQDFDHAVSDDDWSMSDVEEEPAQPADEEEPVHPADGDQEGGRDGDAEDNGEDDADVEQLHWEQLRRDAEGPGPTVFRFQGTPGVNPDCGLTPETATPLACYKQFVSDEVFADITEETNRYAKECRPDDAPAWKTTVGELKIFWALCMLMGVLGKPLISLYWSTRGILHTPIFSKTMTRDRFKLILSYLHFCNNDERPARDAPNHDSLFKVRKYYDKIVTSFTRVFTPGEYISVDEGMIRFFGRLSFKTYAPLKPAKYGMKAYKVCDQTGYTWKFQLYTGKTDYVWQHYTGLVALVMSLLDGLLHQGRKVFMDNFYTSPTLFLALFKCKTNACGTVRSNRKHMPKELNKSTTKMKPGESLFMRAKNLITMLWNDKRKVAMLTTMHNSSFENSSKTHRQTGEAIKKPSMVLDYNKHMGSVDVSDFLTSVYTDLRKTLKWYKKLVFHLSDLSVTNAFIVYKEITGKPIRHLDFILDLIDELLLEGQREATERPKPCKRRKSPSACRENPTRLEFSNSKHWPTEIPATEQKQKQTRLCEVCKPARKESRLFCPSCNVTLHPQCFERYHTKMNYRNNEE